MQRPRGRVHEVCQEVTRVAELVLAARVRQGHHQVVALGETEQDVLHRRACSPCQTTTGETRGRSLSQEDPLEKKMATHSSILAWNNPMDRGACESWTIKKAEH